MRKKLTAARKRLITTVAWTALVVFLTFYIVFQLSNDFTPALATGNAVSVSETVSYAFDAYIMRDETVLVSRNGGYCDWLVADGGYSGTGAPLVNVYESDNAATTARIAEMDARLSLLGECSDRLGTGGIGRINDEVRVTYRELTDRLASGDTSGALSAKNGLVQKLFSLEQNSGSGTDIAERLAASKNEIISLQDERRSLTASLGAYETVSSVCTGNLFHSADGLEEAYSSAAVSDMTLDDFRTMLSAVPLTDADRSGHAVGSYMNNHEWFIAVPCKTAESTKFYVGRSYRVNFAYTSGVSLSMTLERKVTEGSDPETVMVFSCGSTPSGFDRTRCQKIEIEAATYRGYRIPKNALRLQDNTAGVWILTAGKVSWRNVTVIYENGLYCICEPQPSDLAGHIPTDISLNDTFIISDSRLYEGKLIN